MPKNISPLIASNLLLSLHANADNNIESERLLDIVRGTNNEWIKKNGLTNITIRLLAMHQYKPSSINGAALAIYAKRLLAAEDEVGGPYSYKKENKVRLNTLVANLFFSFGSPLPKLSIYLNSPEPHEPLYQTSTNKKIDPITRLIKQELASLDPTQKNIAIKIYESIIDFDQQKEITMLTEYFCSSLKVMPSISSKFFENVGVANFYAWMAYSIYDDLIDNDEKVDLLPLANILQRKSIYRYLCVSDYSFIQKFYDEVDESNFYELNNFRFSINSDEITLNNIPDYGDGMFLARRSIGHVLGPCIIIQDYLTTDDLQKNSLNKALKYFLIAKQLNDDVHDWVEDLKNGHISYVVSFLLDRSGVLPGIYPLESLINKLRHYFWQSGLKEISDLTLKYIESSLVLFEKSKSFNMSGSFFKQVLEPIQQTAEKSINVLEDQKQFLKKYSQL